MLRSKKPIMLPLEKKWTSGRRREGDILDDKVNRIKRAVCNEKQAKLLCFSLVYLILVIFHPQIACLVPPYTNYSFSVLK